MNDISEFDILRNWKLLHGSHDFPGPDGGTCINEAALVVAGFKYRSVSNADDLPRCFSRVISSFSISLNDRMPDGERQRLIPFIPRLAGTADTKAVERQRMEWVVWQVIRVDVPNVLNAIGLHKQAKRLMESSDFKEAQDAAYAAATAANATAYAAANAANAAATTKHPDPWSRPIELLEGLLSMGKKAEPIECAIIEKRVREFIPQTTDEKEMVQ